MICSGWIYEKKRSGYGGPFVGSGKECVEYAEVMRVPLDEGRGRRV